RAQGLSPFLHTSRPLEVKMPQRMRSRREICPSARALTISARLSRARCASLCRMRDALLDMYMAFGPLNQIRMFSADCGVRVEAPRAQDFSRARAAFARASRLWKWK